MEEMYLYGSSLIAFLGAGFAANKILKTKYLGLGAGLIYALIPYRFYSLQISRDYKEAISWLVLPLLLYGVFLLYQRGVNKVLAMLLWMGASVIVTNLPLWLRDFPLFLRGEWMVGEGSLQQKGVYPVQYLMTYFGDGENTNFGKSGMLEAAPVGIGFILTIGVVLYVWLMVTGRVKEASQTPYKKQIGFANGMLVTGLMAAFLSSNVFPWDDLRFSSKLYDLTEVLIQNPARLMSVTAGSFWLVTCVAVALCMDWKQEAKA